MLSCADATQRMSEGLDRHLPWRARTGLRFHVMMCSACRRYRRQILGIEALLRRRPKDASSEDSGTDGGPFGLSPTKREEIKRSLGS